MCLFFSNMRSYNIVPLTFITENTGRETCLRVKLKGTTSLLPLIVLFSLDSYVRFRVTFFNLAFNF